MSIIVTPGEKTLLQAFEKAGVEVVKENLLVGDIHIRRGDKTIYIFERKAKGDLDASIKDGRYKEQKSRLFETGLEKKNIVYIIEQLSKPQGPGVHTRVWSAMCNSFHRDGISVFKTASPADTVDYLVAMARAVEKFSGDEEQAESNVTINIKKKHVGKDDLFKFSLILINNCSEKIADVIVKEYPTMSDLVATMLDKGNGCLADLKSGGRRIGNKLSADICQAVYNAY